MGFGGGKEHSAPEDYLRLGGACHLVRPLPVQSYGCHTDTRAVGWQVPENVVKTLGLTAVLLHSHHGYAPVLQQLMDKRHLQYFKLLLTVVPLPALELSHSL